MAFFIKTGFWEKRKSGPKGWLNMDDVIRNTLQPSIDSKVSSLNNIVELTDSSTIDLSSTKHSLTTASSTRTFTISYPGDDINIEVILNTVSSTFTFPITSLCVSEGVASGDNTLPLSGNVGDRYIISIKRFDASFYVVAKNFGQ